MKFIETVVVENKKWTSSLYSLFVEAKNTHFTAGQFTQISLDKGHLFRPYSFVNAPQEGLLEFYYNEISNGTLTPFLSKIEKGMPVWIVPKGAGRFTLAEVADAPILWLLATGTGLGPFLSMLKTAEPWQRFATIVLVHSVRFEKELTHQALIAHWQKNYPNQFYWFPIVTRGSVENIASLRITDLLASGSIEREVKQSLTPENSQVMLCGNPQMVSDVSIYLQSKGLSLNRSNHPGQITSENYWKE